MLKTILLALVIGLTTPLYAFAQMSDDARAAFARLDFIKLEAVLTGEYNEALAKYERPIDMVALRKKVELKNNGPINLAGYAILIKEIEREIVAEKAYLLAQASVMQFKREAALMWATRAVAFDGKKSSYRELLASEQKFAEERKK